MKTQILLISDDQNLRAEVLGILKNDFDEIEVDFAPNYHEVVEKLQSKEFSVLFVDYTSKTYDPIKMINVAKEKSPATFRVFIYDIAKKESALYSSASVHRFLQKPIKTEELKKHISHFIRLKNSKLDADTIASINELGVIPILPDIYLRLEREMNKHEVSIHRIADIISDDPTVAAKILHIIYTSFYNVSKGLVNLIHAINFLGLDIIKHLVLYVKIFSVKTLSQESQSQLKYLRDHSILVAKVAKAIMNMETKDRELIDAAYVGGLLHDIGKIMLIQFNDKPLTVNGINGKSITEKKEIQDKVSHIEVGSYLLSLWNFAPELVDAVTNHHNLDILNSQNFSLDQVVLIANALINSDTAKLKRVEEVYGKQKLLEWTEIIPGKLGAA